MSLEAFGWLLVAIGLVVFLYGYHLQRERIREARHWSEARREIDRAVPTWTRLQLYDWSDRGDL